jgi:hypothetical protein
MLSIRAF